MFSGLIDELELFPLALSSKAVVHKFTKTKGSRCLAIDKYARFWLDYELLASDRYAPQKWKYFPETKGKALEELGDELSNNHTKKKNRRPLAYYQGKV